MSPPSSKFQADLGREFRRKERIGRDERVVQGVDDQPGDPDRRDQRGGAGPPVVVLGPGEAAAGGGVQLVELEHRPDPRPGRPARGRGRGRAAGGCRRPAGGRSSGRRASGGTASCRLQQSDRSIGGLAATHAVEVRHRPIGRLAGQLQRRCSRPATARPARSAPRGTAAASHSSDRPDVVAPAAVVDPPGQPEARAGAPQVDPDDPEAEPRAAGRRTGSDNRSRRARPARARAARSAGRPGSRPGRSRRARSRSPSASSSSDALDRQQHRPPRDQEPAERLGVAAPEQRVGLEGGELVVGSSGRVGSRGRSSRESSIGDRSSIEPMGRSACDLRACSMRGSAIAQGRIARGSTRRTRWLFVSPMRIAPSRPDGDAVGAVELRGGRRAAVAAPAGDAAAGDGRDHGRSRASIRRIAWFSVSTIRIASAVDGNSFGPLKVAVQGRAAVAGVPLAAGAGDRCGSCPSRGRRPGACCRCVRGCRASRRGPTSTALGPCRPAAIGRAAVAVVDGVAGAGDGPDRRRSPGRPRGPDGRRRRRCRASTRPRRGPRRSARPSRRRRPGRRRRSSTSDPLPATVAMTPVTASTRRTRRFRRSAK